MAVFQAVASQLSSIISSTREALFPDDDPLMEMHLERGREILGSLTREADGPKALHLDWMKEIPDDRLLFQLTVPGTHDSAAYNYAGAFKEFWNCQNVPLFRQLDAGIRALDLRYGLDNGKLLLFHSVVVLDKEAEVVDIIWGLHAWLKEHPHETIFVSLKVDNGNPTDPVVQHEMEKVLKETNNFWVSDLSPRTNLSDARGKLVLVRRFPFPSKVGYSVSENWAVNGKCFDIPLTEDNKSVACIEDFYLLQGHAKDAAAQIKIKKGHTITHLNKAQRAIDEDPKDLYITFASAVGDRANGAIDEDVTPRVMALGREDITGMNGHLINWFQDSGNKPVGIVFMDFATTKRKASAQSNDEEEEESKLIHGFIQKQM